MGAALKEVEQLVSGAPEHVRDLAMCTRDLILSVLPEIDESVDHKARVVGYGFGSGYKNLVCTIILSKKEIKLGIANGASLPDPDGLLQGEGKRHRHVPLRHANDLEQAGLVELLRASAANTRMK